MASRQERRKAEREAAKRAPANARAEGAAGAAAALANVNVNVNPVGDWTTQAADPNVLPRALGADILKRRAAEGDRQGLTLVHLSAQHKRFLWEIWGAFRGCLCAV
jgi:hypothetical protein